MSILPLKIQSVINIGVALRELTIALMGENHNNINIVFSFLQF